MIQFVNRTRKTLGSIAFIVLSLTVIFTIGVVIYFAYQKHRSPADWETCHVYGVDVSNYQGTIQWSYVKKSGIEFAFIKATEGKSILDKRYLENKKGCKENNILYGPYHYYRSTVPWKEQFEWIIKNIVLDKGELPLVIDAEEYDFFHTNTFISDLTKLVRALETHYHIKPIIYSHQHFYNKYLIESFDAYPIWIAKYDDDEPVLKNNTAWHFWQYTDKGHIEGIPFYIDMNCFEGDLNTLLLLTKK